ncbi:MAG: YbdD/YjiX family protein [Sphingomonadales bacterium]|nr:YbdD/YjiX family protein [Sphingomonadales bacterium]MDE2170637.1 YbdD/YjiX family protein [Sphingomonadales bacterium]
MRFVSLIYAGLQAMVGLGDYDAYSRHCAKHHPGEPMMTREQFFRDRQDARYGGKNGGRCC